MPAWLDTVAWDPVRIQNAECRTERWHSGSGREREKRWPSGSDEDLCSNSHYFGVVERNYVDFFVVVVVVVVMYSDIHCWFLLWPEEWRNMMET